MLLGKAGIQLKTFKDVFAMLWQGNSGSRMRALYDALEVFGYDTLELIGCPGWTHGFFLYEVR